jgi:hypothetical protein
MSGLWSGQPNTIKLGEPDVVRATLDCGVDELMLPEPEKAPVSNLRKTSRPLQVSRSSPRPVLVHDHLHDRRLAMLLEGRPPLEQPLTEVGSGSTARDKRPGRRNPVRADPPRRQHRPADQIVGSTGRPAS